MQIIFIMNPWYKKEYTNGLAVVNLYKWGSQEEIHQPIFPGSWDTSHKSLVRGATHFLKPSPNFRPKCDFRFLIFRSDGKIVILFQTSGMASILHNHLRRASNCCSRNIHTLSTEHFLVWTLPLRKFQFSFILSLKKLGFGDPHPLRIYSDLR